jgi:hypothetical protein
MMGGRVVHCKKEPYDIYIGKPSKWENPFRLSNRKKSIIKHANWVILQDELMKDILELDGKILGCWCKPKPCHGDTLIELAEIVKAGKPLESIREFVETLF